MTWVLVTITYLTGLTAGPVIKYQEFGSELACLHVRDMLPTNIYSTCVPKGEEVVPVPVRPRVVRPARRTPDIIINNTNKP